MAVIKKNDAMLNSLSSVHEVNVNAHTREIYLHGDVNDRESDESINYRVAANFIKNINVLTMISHDPIVIHQMSPGGEWDTGMAIFDSLSLTPCYSILVVHGKAYSMASITMQAATARMMQPNASFMIHFGWCGSFNTSLGSIEEARIETLRNKRMLEIYAERCQYGEFFSKQRMPKEDVIKYIDNRIKGSGDWYMSAEESVYYGFADCIAGTLDKNKKELEKIQKNIQKHMLKK